MLALLAHESHVANIGYARGCTISSQGRFIDNVEYDLLAISDLNHELISVQMGITNPIPKDKVTEEKRNQIVVVKSKRY